MPLKASGVACHELSCVSGLLVGAELAHLHLCLQQFGNRKQCHGLHERKHIRLDMSAMLITADDAMQACVIYRDIDDGPKVTEVSDFVNKQGLDAMTSFLTGVCATGGADECESVASGLEVPWLQACTT